MNEIQPIVNDNESLNSVKFTKYQKQCLTCILVVGFASFSTMSLIAPFFPAKASELGLTTTQSGLVFSFYAISSVVFSPVLGKVASFGPKKFMLTGIFCNGFSNILFGLLGYVTDKYIFFYLCLFLRTIEAFGTMSHVTSAYIYVIKVFPKNISYAFGLTETFAGMGLSIGPAIGGLIYTYGGYGLPFYIFGSFILFCFPLVFYLIDEIDGRDDSTQNLNNSETKVKSSDKKQPSNNFSKIFLKPKALVNSFVLVFSSTSFSFLFSTLEEHLKTFDNRPQVAAFEFFLGASTYVVSSFLISKIKILNKYQFLFMFLGILIDVIGLLLIGPSPFIWFLQPSLLVTSFGLFFLGMGNALALIPTFECYNICCTENNLKNDLNTYGKISSLWGGLYSLGEAIGPLLGGYLLTIFNFQVSATLTAILISSIIPVLLLMVIHEMKNLGKNRSLDLAMT